MSTDKIVGRIFPNGEFGIGRIKAKNLEALIGSSNVVNSHKMDEDLEKGRALRGSQGISTYGRKMVRNGAYILERKYGKDVLAFLTLTLPDFNEDMEPEVLEKWAELVRLFLQQLKRKLRKAGLDGQIVGVTELQTKRLEKHGVVAPHLHLVFRAKENRYKKGWAMTCQEYREMWRREVVYQIPEFRYSFWNAAENVQKVDKSAEAYLGKYLSKGCDQLREIQSRKGVCRLVSGWWHMTKELKDCIKENTIFGEDVAEKLLANWSNFATTAHGRGKDGHKFFAWFGILYLPPDEHGMEHEIARYGKLLDAWFTRLYFGLSPSGIYEFSLPQLDNSGAS